MIIEANKNVNNEPALKNSLFNNSYVKLETARSLLNDEYPDWIQGLDKTGYNYGDLNTICWMTVFMENYVNKVEGQYKSQLKNETVNDVHRLYGERQKIISYATVKIKLLETL